MKSVSWTPQGSGACELTTAMVAYRNLYNNKSVNITAWCGSGGGFKRAEELLIGDGC